MLREAARVYLDTVLEAVKLNNRGQQGHDAFYMIILTYLPAGVGNLATGLADYVFVTLAMCVEVDGVCTGAKVAVKGRVLGACVREGQPGATKHTVDADDLTHVDEVCRGYRGKRNRE